MSALRSADRKVDRDAAADRWAFENQRHAGESSDVVDVVAAEADVLEFQATVAKENPGDPLSMDRLVLKIVPTAAAGADLGERLQRSVQRAIGVTPTVERVAADDPLLSGRGWKTKPIIDLRKLG